MNIVEIENKLPNGLHDAIMRKYSVDYEKSTAIFDIDVWVGDLESKSTTERESYKSGVLKFEGLEYFVVEPPCEVKGTIELFSFSVGDPDVEEIKPSVILPKTTKDSFRTYFFIYKLNAFIHVSAKKVEFNYGT
jgi:hypothetical protein